MDSKIIDKLSELILEIRNKSFSGKVKVNNIIDHILPDNIEISNFPEQKEFPKEIEVNNFPEFPKQKEFPSSFEVSNLPKQKEFPKNISVDNFPDQKDFPKKMEISGPIRLKKPTWYKEFDIKQPLEDLVEFFIELSKKVFAVKADTHKKAENALAVRLVDKDGKNFIDKLIPQVNIQQPLGGGGPPPPTKLGNIDGDTINPATEEKQDSLITAIETGTGGYVCVNNTTNTPLLADGVFLGTGGDIKDYGVMVVGVTSDKPSVTNGLTFEFSPDNTNWYETDAYTYLDDGVTKVYTMTPVFRYYRLRYKNTNEDQGYFHLQTVLKKGFKSSSHKIQDNLTDEDDGELIVSVPKLRTAKNTYVIQSATTSGNAKISL